MEVGDVWQYMSDNPIISGLALLVLSQLVPAVRRALGRGCKHLARWLSVGAAWSWATIRGIRRLTARYRVAVLERRLDSLDQKTHELRKLSNSHLKMIDDNRSMILESRQDTYVRICREIAPHVTAIVDQHEPKLVVSLHLPDGAVLYRSIKPSGSLSENKWIADKSLSDQLRLFHQQGRETGWTLTVLRLDGTEMHLRLRLNDLKPIFLATNEPRMILHVREAVPAAIMRSLVLPLMLTREVAAFLEHHDSLVLDVPREHQILPS